MTFVPLCATVSDYGQCVGCRLPQSCPSNSWRWARGARVGVRPSRVHYAPSLLRPANIWIWPRDSRFRIFTPEPWHIRGVPPQV